MVLTNFTGSGVGFGFGIGCGFGVGWGFGGMPLHTFGLGIGGGCGVGLGLGWGFGSAFGSQYRNSKVRFHGIEFDNKVANNKMGEPEPFKSNQDPWTLSITPASSSSPSSSSSLVSSSGTAVSTPKPSPHLPPSPSSATSTSLKTPRNFSINSISKLYGPVVSLYLGSRHALILSSLAAAAEAPHQERHPLFQIHPNFKVGQPLGYNNTTMFFTPFGPHWRNLRRLTAVELFSTRRLNLLSDIRSNEFLSLVRRMIDSSGEIELKARLFEMTYNSMSKMVVGKRFYGENLEVDIEVANRFREVIIQEGLALVFSFNPRDFFPVLGWLDLLGVERRMERLRPRVDKFLSELVEKQRRQRRNDQANGDVDDGGEAAKEEKEKKRTLVDVMLSMQETDPETYTDDLIKGQILTVLTGGTESTAETVRVMMLLMLSHPEIMKKARTEIDRNIESGRILQESDLPKLPYLQNILKETLRLVPPMQGMPPRESSGDRTIQGYHVPAGTMLFVNVWGIQRDPKLWDDPLSFKPERFAEEKEEEEEDGFTNFKYIPFGAGRRRCPGEKLGLRMVMTVVGIFVQCFDWEPMSEEEVDMKALLGLTVPKIKPVMAKYKVRECMVGALSRV
ncbi:hypothetical protein J5N97_015735 [Dioscorea zingiberensis]|uniref:Cytochrome P450 n=1 Tax=Dioscorea zingiberensis TaxID=325984 RepID=A0A9D5HEV2_9LILI|nr:hypothetical protein J5N97_015735 [Dioscorea zingiberensis]